MNTFANRIFRPLLRSRIALHILSAACGMLIACGINMYSDRDDVALGANLDKDLRANRKEYPILAGHPEVKMYVTNVVQKVVGSPDVQKRAIYPYVVEIIHDDKTINAFCTPGGYIYVYTGLLKFLDNEASLAGVLGHEIAHAERRHATKRITAAYGVQVLLGAALGKNPGQTEEIAANLFTNLGFLQNSRDDEMEADNFSMLYLRSSEYYPGSIKYFFDKIGASGKGSSNSLEKLFLTHPPSDERANNVNAKMNEWKQASPAESQLLTARYQAFKKKLP
jgi:predicted Zn-dependent protease